MIFQVFINVHRYLKFYEFSQMHGIVYSPLKYSTEKFHHPKKIPCASPFNSVFFRLCPGKHWYIYHLHSLTFSRLSNNWVLTHWLIILQFSSVAQLCLTLRPHELQHARLPCPSPTPGVQSHSTSIESVMPSSHLILCRPLLLLPSIPPSIRVFSNESTFRMR